MRAAFARHKDAHRDQQCLDCAVADAIELFVCNVSRLESPALNSCSCLQVNARQRPELDALVHIAGVALGGVGVQHDSGELALKLVVLEHFKLDVTRDTTCGGCRLQSAVTATDVVTIVPRTFRAAALYQLFTHFYLCQTPLRQRRCRVCFTSSSALRRYSRQATRFSARDATSRCPTLCSANRSTRCRRWVCLCERAAIPISADELSSMQARRSCLP